MVAAVKSFRSQEKVPLHAILVQSEITQIQRVKISTTNAKKLLKCSVYMMYIFLCVFLCVCVRLVCTVSEQVSSNISPTSKFNSPTSSTHPHLLQVFFFLSELVLGVFR